MPITLPSTDPATHYYRPLCNGRIILIANSDLAWSVALTRRYARRKRIPFANIVSIAMGTGTVYSPASGAAWVTNFLTPVTSAINTVLAQMVLCGPGVPVDTSYWGTTDLTTYSAAGRANIPTSNLAMCARELTAKITASGYSITAAYSTSVGGLMVYMNAAGSGSVAGFFGSGIAQYRLGLSAQSVTPDPLYTLAYTGVGTESIELPTQAALDGLGAVTNTSIPGGRIGTGYGSAAFVSPATDPPTEYRESQEVAAIEMDQGLNYTEALNPANRYRQKIHFQFENSGFYNSLAYLHSQLIGWGYDSTYMYRSGTVSAMEPYAPHSGGAYTLTDLQAGRVRDYPYHVMAGVASNSEMFAEPYRSAWQPTGGGGSLLGPSEGWAYNLGGQRRGGAGGLNNALHVTANFYTQLYAMCHMLLRGGTWAEAVYYTGDAHFQYCLPVGDPLARPFPQ